MRRATLLWVLASGLGLLAFQPTFRSDTRLVEINVVVRDKSGPVSNLTKNDFMVTDAGKPRTIAVFSMTAARQSGEGAPALPANTFSNRFHSGQTAPASVTIFLFDRLNTLTGPGSQPYEERVTWVEDQALANARLQMLRFVATLDPKDRVAIYSLGQTLDVVTDFTGDRERLHAVLERYQPISITRREDVEPLPVHTPVPGNFNDLIDQDRRALAAMFNRDRAATTMAALVSIAAHVADIPGRKNLIWLTANLPFSAGGAARALSRANVAVYPVDARGLLPQSPPSDESDAGTPMIFQRVGNPTGRTSQPTGIYAMQDLAQQTGGRAFINTNDLAGAMQKAVDDAAVTYTIGFYADARSVDGKFHPLKVRVGSGNYEVRYPAGYLAVRDTPAGDQDRLLESVLTPLESPVIGLRARVDRTDQPNPESLRVTGTIDLRDLQLEEKANGHSGAVDVYIFQQDGTGALLDRWHDRYPMQFTNQQFADYLKGGAAFRATITPRAGLATLRLLVADPRSSRIGSLIIPVAAVQ